MVMEEIEMLRGEGEEEEHEQLLVLCMERREVEKVKEEITEML